jgi:MerR family transcriptional regulator, light-induced transcriptional regulator
MADSGLSVQATHSIGAVERDTGLGKDTLRVWERRYQFPQPQRDANGERVYPLDQVNKLRLLKRLIDNGHRPGKIIHLDYDALLQLTDGLAAAQGKPDTAAERADLQPYLDLCKAHEVEELRRTLSQALFRLGLKNFVVDVIAPLTHLVGDCWARGIFAVYEEHLYTEVAQNLLRNAISAIMQRPGHSTAHPCILLTTFPQEQHGLGLLMAEAIFALEGARCVSLGVQTPIIDIIRAAEMQQADIVALSFSMSMSANQVLDGLTDLAAGLAGNVEIWAGGGNPALTRLARQSVHVFALADIPEALAAWQRQRV